MLAFEVRGGFEAARRTLESVTLVVSAVSLGATDTLIQHPAGLTHRCVSDDARAATGISAGLLRLSVGIEDPDDLWRDLEQALDTAHAVAADEPATARELRRRGQATREARRAGRAPAHGVSSGPAGTEARSREGGMAYRIRRVEYFHATVVDQPGEAYKVLSALASLGVNLLGFTGVPVGPDRTQITLFPEDPGKMRSEAQKAGMALDGPHRALLVQGDDELGVLATVHEKLYRADVNVYASTAIADGAGKFGHIIYVRPEDYERADEGLAGLGRFALHRQGRERLEQLVGRLPALRRVLREPLQDQCLELRGQLRVDAAGLRRGLLDVRHHHRHRVLALERQLARERLEEHHRERVDVGAEVGRLALRLLGRHVVGRPHHRARRGEARACPARPRRRARCRSP